MLFQDNIRNNDIALKLERFRDSIESDTDPAQSLISKDFLSKKKKDYEYNQLNFYNKKRTNTNIDINEMENNRSCQLYDWI